MVANYSTFYVRWDVCPKLMLNFIFFKLYRRFLIYIRRESFIEILSLKILLLIVRDMLDLLIMDLVKLWTRIGRGRLTPFVAVLSIWPLKCCLSNAYILFRKGHSYEIDFYCLGALLYELVIGLPPYYSRNQN